MGRGERKETLAVSLPPPPLATPPVAVSQHAAAALAAAALTARRAPGPLTAAAQSTRA